MKYLNSIFEKFESEHLSGIIKFISKDSRKKFLNDIKIICVSQDYPMSKLSNEDFKYMRFNEAYKLMDGDGKSDLSKYLKFWFNTNGDYIGITKFTTSNTHSTNLNDYTQSEPIHYTKVPHLSRILIQLGGTRKEVIGTLFASSDRVNTRYAITNDSMFNGSTPYNSWNKYGKFSWALGGGDHGANVRILTLKDELKQSPSAFNIPTTADQKEVTSGPTDIREFLKNAEFALILNLKNLNTLKLSDIKSKRQLNKPKILSEEEIKKANFTRYMSTLSKYDPNGDLDQLTTIIPRMLGWNQPAFFIYWGTNLEQIKEIIHYLFRIYRKEFRIQEYVDIIIDQIKLAYNSTTSRYSIILSNLKNCKLRSKNENNQNVLSFLDKYELLNETIKKYIYRDVKSISDLEITERKINSIGIILKNERYTFYRLRPFLNSLTSAETKTNPSLSYEKLREVLNARLLDDMDLIINIIKGL